MAFKHYTNRHAVQLLATQSRRTDINSIELCKVHFEMGKYLAYQMLDDFELCEIEIPHVQGLRKGQAIANGNQIVIIAMMRSGLYAAEGVRSVFSDSMLIADSHEFQTICQKYDFKNKTVIIIDAVVNSGNTIRKVLDMLYDMACSRIVVGTLLMQKEASEIAAQYTKVSFYALRVSENKYVGQGHTDTGNRLFNVL